MLKDNITKIPHLHIDIDYQLFLLGKKQKKVIHKC